MEDLVNFALAIVPFAIAGMIFRAVFLLVRKKGGPIETKEEEQGLFNSPKNWGKKRDR